MGYAMSCIQEGYEFGTTYLIVGIHNSLSKTYENQGRKIL
jgi:hypothetical protein